MTTLGERVKTERMAKGWTQTELAEQVTWAGFRITYAAIAQIERRGNTKPRSIVHLADALGVSVNWLASGLGDRMAVDEPRPPSAPRRRRPNARFVPVFASARSGGDGAAMLTGEPIAWIPRDARLEESRQGYGCFASGDSMEPAYERGNLLLVNPAEAVSAGDDCVFLREVDGTRWALIRRLVGGDDDSWSVRQLNPERTYMLPREDWPNAHLIIGKYNRWT